MAQRMAHAEWFNDWKRSVFTARREGCDPRNHVGYHLAMRDDVTDRR